MPARAEQNTLVERVKREIHHHLDASGNQLTCLLRVSPEHLSSTFKEETGKTLHHYVVRQRIRTARLLLTTTSLSCTDIAARLGYRRENYFARIFKKHTGMTPSQFRKNAPAESSP